MKYEKQFLIVGIVIMLLSVLEGCGGGPSGSPEQINLHPGWPNIEKCHDADIYKMKVRVTGKITSDSAYAWFQILKQDSVILTSEATTIRSQTFATPVLYAYFTESQIPPGQYDLQTYIAGSLEDVGDVYKRRVADGPRKFTIDYTQISLLVCVAGGILLGDSVYVRADSLVDSLSPIPYYWGVTISTSPIFYNSDFHFQIRDTKERYTSKFLKLDNNLFFPLKLSREDPDMNGNPADSVIWELTVIRNRQGGPSDTERVRIYVDPPSELGETNNQYDTLIILAADQHAVPPQVIKAIIDQESDFDPEKVRYEMRFDYNSLQLAINQNSYSDTAYYRHYYIADSARTGLRQGIDREGDSVTLGDSVRLLYEDPYQILRDWSLSPPVQVIDTMPRDSLISSYELRFLNDRWSGHPADNWTAQILLASSHGLMQPLQTSLIDYDGFQRRNPLTLYDPETGIYWGAKHLSTIFYGYVNQNYNWQTKLRAAIGKYNGGPNVIDNNGQFPNRPDIENYVSAILNHMDEYQPNR